MPRLAHSKSRYGCKSCKKRKVKCDERKPRCGACEKHDIHCEYALLPPHESDNGSDINAKLSPDSQALPLGMQRPELSLQNGHSAMNDLPLIGPDLTYTRDDWHLIELQLMQQYCLKSCHSFFLESELWRTIAPDLSFHHSFLLDGLLAFAALHIARVESRTDRDWASISIQLHQKTVREFYRVMYNITFDNYEAICLSSSLILTLEFAWLGKPQLNDPPLQGMIDWYHLGLGSRRIFQECREWTHTSERLALLFQSEPKLSVRPELFGSQNRRDVDWADMLLTHEPDSEPMPPNTVMSYESTLNYICSIYKAIRRGEYGRITCRRITAMPAICGSGFVTLVIEKRPRALVMLAYVFALLELTHTDVWLAENISLQMIPAVYDYVPSKWKPMMKWPMDVIGGKR